MSTTLAVFPVTVIKQTLSLQKSGRGSFPAFERFGRQNMVLVMSSPTSANVHYGSKPLAHTVWYKADMGARFNTCGLLYIDADGGRVTPA